MTSAPSASLPQSSSDAGDEAAARARPARERAYEVVRTAILRGTYPAGTFIEEEAITRVAGVSRTPVREAFHRLESERFLELLPRRGARVRQVTAREMLDMYETRRIIEGFAIDRICATHGDALDELSALAKAMRAEGGRDLTEHVDLDRQFHRAIVAGSRNIIMLELYDSLNARQQHVALAAVSADPSRIDTILDEHDALVAAVARRDTRAAHRIIEAHLQPIQHVVETLGSE